MVEYYYLLSRDAYRYRGESEIVTTTTTTADKEGAERTRCAHELGRGISGSTIERVRSIMEYGTPELR
jgi:hypothetical protein